MDDARQPEADAVGLKYVVHLPGLEKLASFEDLREQPDLTEQRVEMNLAWIDSPAAGPGIGRHELGPVDHSLSGIFDIAEILGRMADPRKLPVEQCTDPIAIEEDIVKAVVRMDEAVAARDLRGVGLQPALARSCGYWLDQMMRAIQATSFIASVRSS